MVTEAQKTCRDCDARIPLSAGVCPSCGARQLEGYVPTAGGNKMLKGLVAAIVVFAAVFVIGIFAIAIPKFADTKQRAYVAVMKSDLRRLAAEEAEFAARQGHYTAHVDSLEDFTFSTGVVLESLKADRGGWEATVSHGAVTTRCSMAGGNWLIEEAPPGQPLCETLSATRRR